MTGKKPFRYFKVDEVTHDLFVTWSAMREVRDIYGRRRFIREGKLLKLCKKVLSLKNEAWGRVHKQYPQTFKGQWHYDTGSRTVREGDVNSWDIPPRKR